MRKARTLPAVAFFAFGAVAWSTAAFGYVASGHGLGAAAVLVSALVWIFLRRKAPDFCLLLSTTVAAIGIIVGGMALLMILSAVAALGAWDMSGAELSVSGNASDDDDRGYLAIRLRTLAWALGSGTLLVLLGLNLHLFIPFFVMLPLAALLFFSLDRFRHHLERRGKR